MHHRGMARKLSSSLETTYSTLLDKTLALLCALGSFVLVSQNGFAIEGKSPSGAAVQAPGQFDAIRGEIRARVTKGEFPSFAIGVIQGNTVVWAETFGWADREAHVAATPETAYGLASLGKSITATALMTLVDQGKVGLDEAVAKIIQPDRLTTYEGTADGPTLRQLLNMTAGIPHGALTYTGPEAVTRITEDQVLRNRALVVFPPGQVFHYSNFSIAVADRAIEKISGRQFGDYLSRAVFQPLGMRHSFVAANTIADSKRAVRYDDEGKRIGSIYPFPRSSRGIYASLNDLLAYASFHLQRPRPGQARILSDGAVDTLHNSRSAVPGAYIALGLGSIDLQNGARWIISDGQDMGVQSILSLIPSAGVAVICLTNVTGDQADELSFRVTDILIPGFASQAKAFMKAHEEEYAAFKPSGDWIGEWRGAIKTSAGDLPITMNFEPDGDIKISLAEQYSTLLDKPLFGYGLLSGAFLAKLPLEEKPDHYHRVELGLRRDRDRLYGFAFANFANEKGHFELPTYIALQRVAH
jgi:CubicO group peptidase (beta-lactamase class C family)